MDFWNFFDFAKPIRRKTLQCVYQEQEWRKLQKRLEEVMGPWKEWVLVENVRVFC